MAAEVEQALPTVRVPVPSIGTLPTAGIFVPGTKVQVGSHRVVIQRYLSEGGFAHVYLVKVPKPSDGFYDAVLKRVAVPDKEELAGMKVEVETMKRLKGHRHIVTYIDSHASQLKGGGYEVFLLMEYCAGGGLIDFMNTRLQNRLTEKEVIDIFSDVAEGVACMHYLKPPLLHRDLKVENVLIASTGSLQRYKLCDFGSAAPPRPAATSVAECRLIEEDIQKHTTLQYRSPEMIDVYRKQAIDEKSDIWALGVLLYKLCYYTTPFEAQGQLAILNASFKYPGYPPFSDRLKSLIAWMLRENPQSRPTIYQVLQETCSMQGRQMTIKDIYHGNSYPNHRSNDKIPSPNLAVAVPAKLGATHAPVVVQPQSIPDIIPMRRGRLAAPESKSLHSKPSLSPVKSTAGDPFAALDKSNEPSKTIAPDELSDRFPSLDQFSLLHTAGAKFDFDQRPSSSKGPSNLNQRVTDILADEAFVKPNSVSESGDQGQLSVESAKLDILNTKQDVETRVQTSYPISSSHQPNSPRPIMVSQGTMTSPSSSPTEPLQPTRQRGLASHPLISAESNHHQSASREAGKDKPFSLQPAQRPALSSIHRSKSQNSNTPKPPSLARPSLEERRVSSFHSGNPSHQRRLSSEMLRPSTTSFESNLADIRDRTSMRDMAGGRNKQVDDEKTSPGTSIHLRNSMDESRIGTGVDFLRALEEDDSSRRKEKRSSSGPRHAKRSSLPSLSLTSTKTLLAGKFGDAFRRFENNTGGSAGGSPSPLLERNQGSLSPIAGSEATADRSDDGSSREVEVAPEVKRELERRQLAQEELRVMSAAQEYQRWVGNREPQPRTSPAEQPSIGTQLRATSIQNKVKSLLDESTHTPTRHSTDSAGQAPGPTRTNQRNQAQAFQPGRADQTSLAFSPEFEQNRTQAAVDLSREQQSYQGTASASAQWARRPIQRPNAPPKPVKLRTGGQSHAAEPRPTEEASAAGGHAQDTGAINPTLEDLTANFSKRFPSLSHLEMVETDIDKVRPVRSRGKDV